MARAPKGTPTDLNIFTLAGVFGGNDRVPNRIEPTSVAGMRRCLKAGLVEVATDGTKDLVLTAAGKEALAARAANTILAQLGGNRFTVMTGARSYVGSADTLSFKLPNRFANDGINGVRITLDASDTYTVDFYKIRGIKMTTVKSVSGVYADQLRALFTRVTGLDTSL